MKVRLGGEWKEISGAKTYANGAWRTIVAIKVYADGAWRDVANFTTVVGTPFTVTAPSEAFGSSSLSTVRASVSVTPAGGLAPYTYAWNNGSTRASTTFTETGLGVGEERFGIATCIVTDALGYTATVSINLTFTRV